MPSFGPADESVGQKGLSEDFQRFASRFQASLFGACVFMVNSAGFLGSAPFDAPGDETI